MINKALNSTSSYKLAVVNNSLRRFFEETMGRINTDLFVIHNPKFVKAMFDEILKTLPDFHAPTDVINNHIRIQFLNTVSDRVKAMSENFSIFKETYQKSNTGILFEDWYYERQREGIMLAQSGKYDELIDKVENSEMQSKDKNIDINLAEAITDFIASVIPTEHRMDFIGYNGKFVKELAVKVAIDLDIRNLPSNKIPTVGEVLNFLNSNYSKALDERAIVYGKYINFYKRCCEAGQMNGMLFEDWLISTGRMEKKEIKHDNPYIVGQYTSKGPISYAPSQKTNQLGDDFIAETRLRSVPSIFRGGNRINTGFEHETVKSSSYLQNPGLTDLYYAESDNNNNDKHIEENTHTLDRISTAFTSGKLSPEEEARAAIHREFSGPSIAQLLVEEAQRISETANKINKEGGNVKSMKIAALSADSIRRGEYFRSPLTIVFSSIKDKKERDWVFSIVKAYVRDCVKNNTIDPVTAIQGLRNLHSSFIEDDNRFDDTMLTHMKEYSSAIAQYADQLSKVVNIKSAKEIYSKLKDHLDDLEDLLSDEK
ncbi:hypothetical protein [Pseudomonas phage vB_PaeM_PS119XW]|uniref:Uncharacterized protein n=1 Tax=Pseudomonas phage vB_PaeM_PS119XW TaxID=2601632 RepID=A0A5C1K7E0_9CAUD|nr:hypothetical protein PP933_gp053 [Pseudomonas phage vB_PaeM_PS119XW]QEM41782.1 hypothetical protein [Pseudomonas phage vB_PaeM_PS119XW]